MTYPEIKTNQKENRICHRKCLILTNQYIIICLLALIIFEFYAIKQRAFTIFDEVDGFQRDIDIIQGDVNALVNPLEDFIKNTSVLMNNLQILIPK